MANFKLTSLFLLASAAIIAAKAPPMPNPNVGAQTANPPNGTFTPPNNDCDSGATTWFQTASANADNSTVTL
ncbi:hypothetical protein CF326_g6659, partial [Tilletia indica]